MLLVEEAHRKTERDMIILEDESLPRSNPAWHPYDELRRLSPKWRKE